MPTDTDQISPLDIAGEKRKLFRTKVILPDIDLDFIILVAEVGKDSPAMVPDGVQPA